VWTPAALPRCSREVTREPVLTAHHTVTVVRTVVPIVLAMTAVAQTGAGLLVAAYLVYWVGDLADGEVARRLRPETRIGQSPTSSRTGRTA
jgi:phosphatidylglycerophosphate synthase